MNKAEMIAALEQQRADWHAILEQLAPQHMEQPGVMGDWTFKDVVSHLTGWRKRTMAVFEAAANNTDPEPPEWPAELGSEEESDDNVPGINNWFYEKDHNRPLADVLDESEDVFNRLDVALRRVREEDLNDPNRYPWLEGWPLSLEGTLGHYYEDHEPGIKAWLAAQS